VRKAWCGLRGFLPFVVVRMILSVSAVLSVNGLEIGEPGFSLICILAHSFS
jgi:hypothetical protein